jgi:rhodanese-related sulfurtransferase
MSFTKEQVLKELKSDSVVILNVLSEANYEKVHIKGSRNIPWGSDREAFARRVEEAYGKDKLFITHCSGPSCSAGPSAAKFLKEKGFKAEDYPGGMEEWMENGLPVDEAEAPMPAPV